MVLDIQISGLNETSLITVTGEVDLYTSPELRTAILDAVPEAGAKVALDLSGVRYMDSSGVATLVEGFRSARDHAKAFTLVNPSAAVMKVLELARLDRIFEVSSKP
jgi:anti-sigma B factor antagonist